MWFPLQNHVTWGRHNLWNCLPGISPGVKMAGVFGWRTTTIVVRNVKIIWGLKLPGTPWTNTVCRRRTLLYVVLRIFSSQIYSILQIKALHTSVCNVWRYILFTSVFIYSLFNDAVSSSETSRRMAAWLGDK